MEILKTVRLVERRKGLTYSKVLSAVHVYARAGYLARIYHDVGDLPPGELESYWVAEAYELIPTP